jgi:glyoxalase-like protein
VPATLDHLLWGCGDLDAAIADLYERSGVQATFGGHHPELGTQNALARLDERVFLEVIAPAPALPAGALARQLAKLDVPTLVMWAARVDDPDVLAARAKAAGFAPNIIEGHRARLGGGIVRWTNVFVSGHGAGTHVPFFIAWDGEYHPSEDAPPGLALDAFVIETPDPARLRAIFSALDVKVPVRKGRRDRLRATLETPRGPLVLTGP